MSFRFPQHIYPLTDPILSGLSHLEQVKLLIDGGARFIQLREKHAAPDQFYAEAVESIEFAHKHGVQIVINDRVDIALAVRADGVHLGQEDLPPTEARKLLGDQAVIGFSTHNLEQVRYALTQPIDYVAFGPIFSTLTKENPDPTVGLVQLAEVRNAIGDFPLVAIGGINAENYRDVLNAGADSVAIVSAIVSQPELISQRVKSFLTIN